jgi:hypothetical protein
MTKRKAKAEPTLRNRLEGLGFENVHIRIEGGVTYVAMTWDGQPIGVTAHPLDDPFEIAKGWAAHKRG